MPYVHNMTDSNSNTSSNNSEFETELPDMETRKKVGHKNYSHHRTYSRPFLEVTISPNLVPWVLTKIFSLEMVKNDVFKGCKKTKCPFFRKKCTHGPNVYNRPCITIVNPKTFWANRGFLFSEVITAGKNVVGFVR